MNNVFNLSRHLLKACHYRMLRGRAFASRKCAVEF